MQNVRFLLMPRKKNHNLVLLVNMKANTNVTEVLSHLHLYFQGVISVSGVYDLLCLNNTLLKPVYLQPTFGYACDLWLSASPAHVIKSLDHVSKTAEHVTETGDHMTKSKERVTTEESHVTTKFLLLSAEKDPFLKQQSLDFYETLLTKGWACEHVEIGGTNHFSIITGSGADPDSPLQLTIDFISKHNE